MSSRKRPTVLIVDDDPAIRKMLVEVLALEGFPTETAANGREALQLLAQLGPRVILLDLLMPEVDGRGVVQQLEADPSARARHQIILVSAWANLEGVRDLQVEGRLPKPFTVDQLLNTLEPVAGRA
ncbi:MAG TPA: response regulator [Ktedonobacterales bacterium]|jgi:CheY-like chemotaxis protein|nr:response regulator [Ktedonobacterales bacterium]